MNSPTVYQYLLRLLPRHVRRNYGDEMTHVFEERLAQPGSRPLLWVREAGSVVAAAFRTRIIENLIYDLSAVFRLYARNPGFAITAVLLLAVGIGGFTANYSLLDAWVLQPLPYKNPSQLTYLSTLDTKRGFSVTASAVDFEDWKHDPSFEAMAAWNSAGYNLTGSGDPERLRGSQVSANFMRILGVAPAIGRDFTDGEDKPGAPRTAILSHELWESRFLSDPALIGKTIELDNEQVTVVGVLPQHFQFPLMGRTQLLTPLVFTDADQSNRGRRWLQVLARRKNGVTPEQAFQSLAAMAKSIAAKFPDTNQNSGIYYNSLADEIGNHQGNTVVWAIFGITFFVLMIVCSNIAGLMLAKSVERQKEVAVRFALGASRGRVIRQFLTEHALLFLAGAAGSVAVAYALAGWIGNSIPYSNRVYLRGFGQVPVHSGALVFAFATALISAIVFGLAPALEGSRMDLNGVLKEGVGRGSPSRRGRFLRDALVCGQIAMATVLLVSNALVVKSLARIWNADIGFRPDNLLTVDVSLPPKAYQDLPKAGRMLELVGEKIHALPGVQASSASQFIPFGDSNWNQRVWIEGQPEPLPGQIPTSSYSAVTPGYFATMSIPVLQGRDFTAADDDRTTRVAVVNDVFANRHWPHESPIGRHIRVGTRTSDPVEIVGVVKQVKMSSFNGGPEMQMYVPMRQHPVRQAMFVVRSNLDLNSAIRSAIWSADANIPAPQLQVMKQSIEEAYTPQRITTQMLTAFSMLALALAAVGLYSMMARSVMQRSREIGIRLALGAKSFDILGTILRRGAIISVTGAALGIACAAMTAQFLALVLYQVSPRDPATYATVAGVLAAVVMMACYLPARRAAKTDPAMALRHE